MLAYVATLISVRYAAGGDKDPSAVGLVGNAMIFLVGLPTLLITVPLTWMIFYALLRTTANPKHREPFERRTLYVPQMRDRED